MIQNDPLVVSRFLGSDSQSGQKLYSPLNYSESVKASPQTGKTTRIMIPRLVDASGAVLATSTRLDVIPPTWNARCGLGPTYVFEPQATVAGVPRLRWSPITGCDDRLVAILRGRAFAAGSGVGGKNVENGQYFEGEAAAIIRALLHAAALDGQATITDVAAWARDRRQRRPERILQAHSAGDWADDLIAYRMSASRTADNISSVVRRAFDCLADPRVLHACSPPPGTELDPEEWLTESGTIYLVGDSGSQASVAPLVTALIEDLVWRARRRAFAAIGGKADPPLWLLLDELCNIAPLPSTPSLMSEGGGSGIPTTILTQNNAQLAERFGDKAGEAISNAASVTILLGGGNDPKQLRDMQALAGKVTEVSHSHSWGAGRAVQYSEQIRREDLLDLAELRTLPLGRGLVLASNLPPFEVNLAAWWERADAADLQTSDAQFRAMIARAA
ncbi:TraM recognition domain-containing protein [Longispora sp. NPDC051575]|uniref:type IV secretory system conjugative DNA transfer family protein n=1 Tax=Longispora sp. NPDC051575 TaxID=3154943 RepID=UPI0034291A97